MPTTGRLRFTGIVSNTNVTNPNNLLEGNTGNATATSPGNVITIDGAGENQGIPASATITGLRFRASYKNLNKTGQITTICRLTLGSQTKNMDFSATAAHNIDEGGQNDLLGFTNVTQAEIDGQGGFRLFTGHFGGLDSLAITGQDTDGGELPSVEIFYQLAAAVDADFTRETLRSYSTHSSNFTAVDHTFTLTSNISTTAGFSMEGEDGKKIMESSSITSLTNCSLVSSSTNVAFLVDSGSTATFTFTPTSTIESGSLLMLAPNTLVYNLDDTTASGSYFGVDLDIST